jgi:hypothetical protein
MNRKKLLLACAISEWDTAITHIETALRTGSITVSQPILDQLNHELSDLLSLWSGVPRYQQDPWVALIAQARAYATEHQAEIDSLLNPKENR